jgi:hypothetical protein
MREKSKLKVGIISCFFYLQPNSRNGESGEKRDEEGAYDKWKESVAKGI